MSTDGQGTKWRRRLTDNFNRLTRVHERYRQTTHGRATAYSEREREFTFANKMTFNCKNKDTEKQRLHGKSVSSLCLLYH